MVFWFYIRDDDEDDDDDNNSEKYDKQKIGITCGCKKQPHHCGKLLLS